MNKNGGPGVKKKTGSIYIYSGDIVEIQDTM
jgi:hypothetical protein